MGSKAVLATLTGMREQECNLLLLHILYTITPFTFSLHVIKWLQMFLKLEYAIKI